jgi:predicted aldo/keto reductase-like oxidoreductase
LTENEKNDIAVGKAEGSLYCQGCEVCMSQCEKMLPIPEIMRAYMYTYGYADASLGRTLLTSLNIEQNPCRDCGACSVECAQGFAVREKIADVGRLVNVPEEFLG